MSPSEASGSSKSPHVGKKLLALNAVVFIAALIAAGTLLGWFDQRLAAVFSFGVVFMFMSYQDGKEGSIMLLSFVPLAWFWFIYWDNVGFFLVLLGACGLAYTRVRKNKNPKLRFKFGDVLGITTGFSAMMYLGGLSVEVGVLVFALTLIRKMYLGKDIRLLPHIFIALLAAFLTRIIVDIFMPGLFI